MASDVDICNQALALLGDSATVSSINPSEGSVQAQHCARFYAIARDAVTEMHTWSFATKTIQLAQLANPQWNWDYNYAQPSDLLKPIKILFNPQLGVSDRFPETWCEQYGQFMWPEEPQIQFSREVDANGNYIICTNEAGAVLKYIAQVTDTTKFSNLYVDCLSMYLASKLAGPLIKGDEGRQQAMTCMQAFSGLLANAKVADAQSRHAYVRHVAPWISGR